MSAITLRTDPSQVFTDFSKEYSGAFALVRDLHTSVEKGRIQRAEELAVELIEKGPLFFSQEIFEKQSDSSLHGALDLMSAFADEKIQQDDHLKYLIGRSARLFLELFCMKIHREELSFDRVLLNDLIEKVGAALKSTPKEQVKVFQELICAREALEAVDQVALKSALDPLTSLIVENRENESLAATALPSLLEMFHFLCQQRAPSWFAKMLYLSWIGNTSGHDKNTLQQVLDAIHKEHSLPMLLTRVEFCADLLSTGSPKIQRLCCKELERLVALKEKRQRNGSEIWKVRMRGIQILAALSEDSAYQDRVNPILIQRRIEEINGTVLSLLKSLEQDPIIHQKWRKIFNREKEGIAARQRIARRRLQNLEQQLEHTSRRKSFKELQKEKKALKVARYQLEVRQSNFDSASQSLMQLIPINPGSTLYEIESLILRAQSGELAAQYNLAIAYENGTGVVQDQNQAIHWYRKAANGGLAHAQFNLAVCYEVTQDLKQAVKWYRKAAHQGDASAQFSLGLCYEYGKGVTQDEERAAKWYRKAAYLGFATAQYNLAVCYEKGDGVTQDLKKAVKWYRRAAKQNMPEAQFALGLCYENGKGVARDEERATKWYRKAAG